jgi:hypothetical protein
MMIVVQMLVQKKLILMQMMKSILFIFFATISLTTYSQDSTKNAARDENITVNKDPRLDVLAKKEAEINDANGVLLGGRAARGFRLMLLNTTDRALAMKVRAQLLQHFPDQKVYMSFQPPYIKLKFGDFLEKDDAESYKTDILNAKIVTANIYVVPELVEIKPDKTSTTPTN